MLFLCITISHSVVSFPGTIDVIKSSANRCFLYTTILLNDKKFKNNLNFFSNTLVAPTKQEENISKPTICSNNSGIFSAIVTMIKKLWSPEHSSAFKSPSDFIINLKNQSIVSYFAYEKLMSLKYHKKSHWSSALFEATKFESKLPKLRHPLQSFINVIRALKPKEEVLPKKEVLVDTSESLPTELTTPLYGSADFYELTNPSNSPHETKMDEGKKEVIIIEKEITNGLIQTWGDELRDKYKYNNNDRFLLVYPSSGYVFFQCKEIEGIDSGVVMIKNLKPKEENPHYAVEVQNIVGNYKIHLMPKNANDLKRTIERIFDLVNTGKLKLANFKVLYNFEFIDDLETFKNNLIRKSHNGVLPLIVLYPHLGKDNAQEVLNIIYEEFKKEEGLNITPRYNEKVTSFIYFSHCNGDEKDGRFLEYFEPQHFIYLKHNFEGEGQDHGKYWLINPAFEQQFEEFRGYLRDDENSKKFEDNILHFNFRKKNKDELTLLDVAESLKKSGDLKNHQAKELLEQYMSEPVERNPASYPAVPDDADRKGKSKNI